MWTGLEVLVPPRPYITAYLMASWAPSVTYCIGCLGLPHVLRSTSVLRGKSATPRLLTLLSSPLVFYSTITFNNPSGEPFFCHALFTCLPASQNRPSPAWRGWGQAAREGGEVIANLASLYAHTRSHCSEKPVQQNEEYPGLQRRRPSAQPK